MITFCKAIQFDLGGFSVSTDTFAYYTLRNKYLDFIYIYVYVQTCIFKYVLRICKCIEKHILCVYICVCSCLYLCVPPPVVE